jgi:hypothetical protein
VSDRFEAILDESISALQAGVPLEDILAEVPDYAAELRPLLYAATVLTDPQPRAIPEERKVALRTEYLKQAAELPVISAPTFSQKSGAIWHIIRRRANRKAVFSDLATMTITLVLTLGMAVLILVYVAQDTLPGDMFYGVKRLSEQTQLGLTFDPTHRDELVKQFNQRRLAEIDRLLAQNRTAAVQFQGVLETRGENLWIVSGLTVFLPDDAAVIGQPREGDAVIVTGFLRPNKVLVADTVEWVDKLSIDN